MPSTGSPVPLTSTCTQHDTHNAQQHQADADAAFQGGLHRSEFNLRTGVGCMRRVWDQYMEMVALNDALAGRRHRYVYGYHSLFEVERIGVAKVLVAYLRRSDTASPEFLLLLL